MALNQLVLLFLKFSVVEVLFCIFVNYGEGYPLGTYDFPEKSLPFTSAAAPVLPEADGIIEKDDLLFPEGYYYTIHLDRNLRTLQIDSNGKVKWRSGRPTLHSVFHEQVYEEPSSRERMYSLEALATRHWLCVDEKGGLYGMKQPDLFKIKSLRKTGKRIRHGRNKKKKARINRKLSWGKRGNKTKGGSHLPPNDCIFQTFEFNPNEDYNSPVGIFSYLYSNSTHGRFLSIFPSKEKLSKEKVSTEQNSTEKPSTEKPKPPKVISYPLSFRNMRRSPTAKIQLLPVSTLQEMVNMSFFDKEKDDKYTRKVRSCIKHLLSCPNHRMKIMEGATNSIAEDLETRKKQGHLYRIVERCRVRAQNSDTLPKCHSSKSQENGSSAPPSSVGRGRPFKKIRRKGKLKMA